MANTAVTDFIIETWQDVASGRLTIGLVDEALDQVLGTAEFRDWANLQTMMSFLWTGRRVALQSLRAKLRLLQATGGLHRGHHREAAGEAGTQRWGQGPVGPGARRFVTRPVLPDVPILQHMGSAPLRVVSPPPRVPLEEPKVSAIRLQRITPQLGQYQPSTRSQRNPVDEYRILEAGQPVSFRDFLTGVPEAIRVIREPSEAAAGPSAAKRSRRSQPEANKSAAPKKD